MIDDLIVEDVNLEDTEDILDIYSYYILNTPVTFEYDIPNVLDFQKRIEGIKSRYPYLKAVYNGRIIGYAYASALRTRPAYDWSCETTIYLHKDYRFMGAGRKLYNKLFDILKKQNITNIYACITYSNKESLDFHKKLGFNQVALLTDCGYKMNKWHSIAWLEKIIAEHNIPPENFINYNLLK